MKFIRVPSELTGSPFNHRALSLKGFSVVESCTHTARTTGTMYLEEHLLLFVIQGVNVLTHGKTAYSVCKNEMILLKKASLISYDKSGDPGQDNSYDSMMFFLKDEFLMDFFKMANIQSLHTKETVKVSVKPVKERLLKFFDSIKPYFNEPENIDAGLLRIKMLELLYDIAGTDKNLLQQLLQMKQPVKSTISEIMENNFSNPVTLKELAYLSGRSLASFKRDFQVMYNMPPREWIRMRRLEKAKELLLHSNYPIKDICFTLGFENPSHFSRIFRRHFGYAPSDRSAIGELPQQ